MVVHNVKECGVEFCFIAGTYDSRIGHRDSQGVEMDGPPQPLHSVTIKGEPDETDLDLPFRTSLKTEVEDFKPTITQELVPEFPEELKYSPPVDLSAHPSCPEAVKSEPEEIDVDLSYKTSPRTEEEDDLKTEMPDDTIDGNSSDGTSPNCASYSLPSSSGAFGELPTTGNLSTSEDEFIAPYRCSWCTSRFRNKCQLTRHLHIRHHIKSEDVIFPCSVCDKIYIKRIEFMKHILELHPHVNLQICPVCRMTFRACWDLHEHLSKYSDDDSYSCQRCNRTFPTMKLLKKHVQMQEEYNSKVCIIDFYKDSARNQRIKPATKKIPASNRHARAQHTSTPSDDNQLDCPRCERKFAAQSSLIKHLRAHKSHPHVCGTCNAMFPRESDLLTHMASPGGQSLACLNRQKYFTKLCSYKRYKKIRTEGRTWTVRRLPEQSS